LSATPVGGERKGKRGKEIEKVSLRRGTRDETTTERRTTCLERNQENSDLGIVGEVFDRVIASSWGHRTSNSHKLETAELKATSDKVTV